MTVLQEMIIVSTFDMSVEINDLRLQPHIFAANKLDIGWSLLILDYIQQTEYRC